MNHISLDLGISDLGNVLFRNRSAFCQKLIGTLTNVSMWFLCAWGGGGGGLGGLGDPLDGGEIPASLLPIFGSLEVLKVILSKAYLL